MHGRAGIGIALVIFHLVAAGGLLYFMYTISKSLKKIAKNLEKKSPLTIAGNQSQQLAE